ncbi:MAG: hypothetical protein GY799_19195 [Desulfobulbaceae bacterium]|nr:hypothetical protein [Desulfobulbaceae bacterium]
MGIITVMQPEKASKHGINAVQPRIKCQQGTGHVKIYGLARVVPLNPPQKVGEASIKNI